MKLLIPFAMIVTTLAFHAYGYEWCQYKPKRGLKCTSVAVTGERYCKKHLFGPTENQSERKAMEFAQRHGWNGRIYSTMTVSGKNLPTTTLTRQNGRIVVQKPTPESAEETQVNRQGTQDLAVWSIGDGRITYVNQETGQLVTRPLPRLTQRQRKDNIRAHQITMEFAERAYREEHPEDPNLENFTPPHAIDYETGTVVVTEDDGL